MGSLQGVELFLRQFMVLFLTLFKNCVGQVQDAAEWIALEILQGLQQTSILRKDTDLLYQA